MRDLEKDIKIGQAVQDTTQTDGWEYIKAKIEQEISDEIESLQEVQEQDAMTMLGEFIDHQKTIKGLGRIFEIIKELKLSKESAENKFRSRE